MQVFPASPHCQRVAGPIIRFAVKKTLGALVMGALLAELEPGIKGFLLMPVFIRFFGLLLSEARQTKKFYGVRVLRKPLARLLEKIE